MSVMRIDHNTLAKLILLLHLICPLIQSQNQTINCGGDCQICNRNNPSQCHQCKPQYYLNQQNICLVCNDGCSLCKGPDSCQSCQYGFTMYQNLCFNCPQFCLSCTLVKPEASSITSCTSCYIGFYSVPFRVDNITSIYLQQSYYMGCSPCIPNCLACQDYESCDECAYGFGYNSTSQQCQLCEDHCLACNDTIGCVQCTDGYYPKVLHQGFLAICVSCGQNCSQCNSDGLCQQCPPGFFPSGQGCAPCIEPCNGCVNQSLCFDCQIGYFLSTNIQGLNQSDGQNITYSSICVPCLQNCQYCQDGNYCQQCMNGFFLRDNQTCEKCGNACTSCNDDGCQQCSGKFYLYDGTCKQCPQLCDDCIANDQEQVYCYSCSSTMYTPIDGKCMLCSDVSEGCSNCFSQTQCTSCNMGYYLLGEQCVVDNQGLATVYIVLISIAGVIGLAAIIFGIWACWRSRNGYGVMGEGSSAGGVRASYYEFP